MASRCRADLELGGYHAALSASQVCRRKLELRQTTQAHNAALDAAVTESNLRNELRAARGPTRSGVVELGDDGLPVAREVVTSPGQATALQGSLLTASNMSAQVVTKLKKDLKAVRRSQTIWMYACWFWFFALLVVLGVVGKDGHDKVAHALENTCNFFAAIAQSFFASASSFFENM